MAREKSDTATNTSSTQADEISRVRDILFGSYMREYERRFRNLEDELERQKERLEELWQRVDALESKVDTSHREVLAEIRKQLDQLYARLQKRIAQVEEESVDKGILGDLLIEFGSRIKGGTVTESIQELLKDHE
ncbi:MAG: hypothetical protein GXO55_02080 [Chloroflexi bacterium]|nr:hypothetical protein [Chloroflexota bacterium]